MDIKEALSCIQCGKCTAGCDISRYDNEFSPHRFVHLAGMGLEIEAISDERLWKCSTCFTCSERCPQGIRITELIWRLKELAFKSGKSPDFLSKQKETLTKSIRAISISEKDNLKRQKAGLPLIEDLIPAKGFNL